MMTRSQIKQVLRSWFFGYFWLWLLLLVPVAILSQAILMFLFEPYGFGGEVDFLGTLVWMGMSYCLASIIASLVAFRRNKNYTIAQKLLFLFSSFLTLPLIFLIIAFIFP